MFLYDSLIKNKNSKIIPIEIRFFVLINTKKRREKKMTNKLPTQGKKKSLENTPEKPKNVTNLTAYRCQMKCTYKEERLQKTLRELENIKFALDKSAIVAIADPKGMINYVNDKFCEISGYAREELIGENYRLLNSGYHSREFFQNMWLTISSGKVWKAEIRDKAKSGNIYWVNTTIVPFLDEEEKPWQYLTIQFDITERKQAETALIESQSRYQNLVNLSPVGIFRTDRQGQYIEANERWCELAGMTVEEAQGEGWAKTIHPEEREQVLAQWYLATFKQLPFKSSEYRLQRPDGVVTWVFAQAVAETNTDGEVVGYVGTITDITERKQAEEKLRHHALHDALTGLPNRAFFLHRLENALEAANSGGKLFAALFLDLNRFKVINDSLGHLVGDRLLCSVAQRLSDVVRSKDMVARLGGDEFTILLENVDSLNAVLQVATRIQNTLSQPFYLEDNQIFSGASIGIVLCGSQQQAAEESWQKSEEKYLTSSNVKIPQVPLEFPHCVLPNPITYHEKPEEILRAADTAMYRAKELGGSSRYVVFNPQMYEQAVALLHLENDLRRAVKTCEDFVLHYQPIISNETGEISGFEALVRWQHPQRGFISPDEFITLAEETGLIIPLGRYVLSQAVLQLRIWQASVTPEMPLTMSVNVSPKQLSHPNFVEEIDEILRSTHVEGNCLNLEITESCLMENPEEAARILYQLRSRGISLSIDDFGTGYSSLSHLSRFPLNTIKIDRSFVKQMGDSGENSSLIWTIVTLAHNLGLDVVAEGVETGLQLELLKKLNCEKSQGYFLSIPLEVETATTLLAASIAKQREKNKLKVIESSQISDRLLQYNNVQSFPQRERMIKRRLASQIRNTLDFNTIVKTTVNEIRHLMQVDCCQFLWYRNDLEQALFEPILKTCQLEAFCPGCLEASTPTIASFTEMLMEKNLVCINDIATEESIDDANRKYLNSKKLKSLLAVAIHPQSGPWGVIVCERTQQQKAWSEEEVEFIEELGEHLAIALDHAKMYEESRWAATLAQAQAAQMQQAMAKLQQTQAQLIQAEKMSSLGLLVAGVAHEVNNPVNFISGNINHAKQYATDLLAMLQLYQQDFPEASAEIKDLSDTIDWEFVRQDLPKVMDSMAMGASRIREIVESLRNFSRLDEAQLKPVYLHEGIDSTLLILQHRLQLGDGWEIEIVKDYGNLPKVECYPGLLNQVFMNLLGNAMDALESNVFRGEIERSPKITIRITHQHPNWVSVSIADNGLGIKEELKAKLFDPFFTTKPVGKGTGLGLSISYQIVVEKHGGRIECFSTYGEGTEFVIEIPVRQGALVAISSEKKLLT